MCNSCEKVWLELTDYSVSIVTDKIQQPLTSDSSKRGKRSSNENSPKYWGKELIFSDICNLTTPVEKKSLTLGPQFDAHNFQW